MNTWASLKVGALVAVCLSTVLVEPLPASGAQMHPAGNSGSLNLHTGSGSFATKPDREGSSPIRVHYYRPRSFVAASPVLIVVPGSGRNGDEYRDAWIRAADRYGVLLLSPEYPEDDYDFAAYHMGGVIQNLEMRNPQIDEHTGAYRIADEGILFDVNNHQDEWLYGDFDWLFDLVTAAVGSTRQGYDIFGHSAGGQILHRLPLFRPESKAQRILAANSGFYTLPRLDIPLPFGLKGTPETEESLRGSFKATLVVLLGELDDETETRGTHLRTPTADAWGTGRLERGKRFYAESRRVAAAIGAPFNWKLEIVPDVGHDQRAMAEAAARYLYGSE